MSKARKSGNRLGEPPSTRDRLSSAFVQALEKDWAEHGSEVIQQIRQDNPVKYGELIARLVPMDANPLSANDYSRCESLQDIGRQLLRQIGLSEEAITDDMIAAAVEANGRLVDTLESIAPTAGTTQ
jgi:hypothetical protein